MANVLTMEAANIFCGDHDPSKSNHLTLGPLKLPALEVNYQDHTAGGAPVGIEVDTHVMRLECTFSLLGWTDYVMELIRASTREKQIFTAYGVIRDRRTGKAQEAKAIMQGQLGRVNPTEFRRGTNQDHEYSIRGIVHYELYLNKAELYFWDFFENAFRSGGTDLNADINQILRIPASV